MSGVDPADIKKAQEKVLGEPSQQSSSEPPAGVTGAGTADQPYDQGNQPEQSVAPDSEPVAGKQGEGTVDKPYDQGNQPEQESMNIVDQLSRTKTKEEIQEKKLRRQSQLQQSTPAENGESKSSANGTVTGAPTIITEDRGRDHTESVTASSAPKNVDTQKLAPKPSRQTERSISPGTLPDGSHVKCSGEMGEAYSPPSGLGKLGRKLHIGH